MSVAAQIRLVSDAGRVAAPAPVNTPEPPAGLGALLVERGIVSAADLAQARSMLVGNDLRLEDALLAHRAVREDALAETLALLHGADYLDAADLVPDARLIDAIGPATCLRSGLLPLRRVGAETLVATSRPDDFDAWRPALSGVLGPVRMVVATETGVTNALLKVRQRALARDAEIRVPLDESCRGPVGARAVAAVIGLVALAVGLAVFAPATGFTIMAAWAAITLVATTGLKAAATIAALRARHVTADPDVVTPFTRSPVVSILVPLFREREIAGRLIERLSRIDYPRELLDILLVVEESDTVTQAAIASTRLPPSMRQVIVPRGGVQTKPRALNYALDFCRGSIVGVYDAEDRPDPAQIRDVVTAFAMRGPKVSCLQGILDYYNARENWLSRCFTVEYATWFRIVLPGLEKLGMVVPLGGTTLFFRRETLEELGGWDAHNVTEDADLGLRLARHGYRTELLTTVTQEEANCRPWPWVKQRSRWLKGYAMTYATHMRDPVRLWKELGAKRFLGIQITFLGTLSQFALAPVLWSFWLLLLGLPHPFSDAPAAVLWGLGGLFLLTEILNVCTAAFGVSQASHRWLIPWTPTLHFYYPLGALAAWKGLFEMIAKPYFWDKTQHGVSLGLLHAPAQRRAPEPPRASAPSPLAVKARRSVAAR